MPPAKPPNYLKLILILTLASLSLQGLAEAQTYVSDHAYVIDDSMLEPIIKDFHRRTDVLISVMTLERSEDIDADAQRLWEGLGIGSFGRRDLSMLILYAHNKGVNPVVTIGHTQEGCALKQGDIEVIKDDLRAYLYKKPTYDEFFMYAVELLQGAVEEHLQSSATCEVEPPSGPSPGEPSGGTGLEFRADDRIFRPRSASQYGLGLSRDLNKYERGSAHYDNSVITHYDPIVCKLVDADSGSARFTITGTKGLSYSDTKDCSKGSCLVFIPPGRAQRGEKLTCQVSSGGETHLKELYVAKHILVFFEINNGQLSPNIRKQFEKFIEIGERVNKNDPEYYFKPIFLDKGVRLEYYGYDEDSLNQVVGYVIKNFYRGDLKYDFYIGVNEKGDPMEHPPSASLISYTEYDSHAINLWEGDAKSYTDYDLAHEMGHAWSFLCDEYDYVLYEDGDKAIEKSHNWIYPDGCPNPWPSQCVKNTEEIENPNNFCKGTIRDRESKQFL
jgi:hypothetical protein